MHTVITRHYYSTDQTEHVLCEVYNVVISIHWIVVLSRFVLIKYQYFSKDISRFDFVFNLPYFVNIVFAYILNWIAKLRQSYRMKIQFVGSNGEIAIKIALHSSSIRVRSLMPSQLTTIWWDHCVKMFWEIRDQQTSNNEFNSVSWYEEALWCRATGYNLLLMGQVTWIPIVDVATGKNVSGYHNRHLV